MSAIQQMLAGISPPGASFNPAWANVKLLLHGDGTNGSTTIADQAGKSVTAFRDTHINTGISGCYGTACIDFDGAGDLAYLGGPSADFSFPGDYLIEARIYPRAWNFVLLDHHNGAGLQIYLTSSTLYFYYNGAAAYFSCSHSMSTDAWNTLAISRVGSSVKAWDNGTERTLGTTSDTTGGSSTPLYIGATYAESFCFNGALEELRITKGEGVSSYTAPTAAFPNS